MNLISSPAHTSTPTATVLWVSDAPPAQPVLDAAGDRYILRPVPTNDTIGRHLDGAVAAIIDATGERANLGRLSALIDQLERTDLLGLILLPDGGPAMRLVERKGQFAAAGGDLSPEALAAKIDTLAQLRPTVAGLREELLRVRTLGGPLASGQIEEEMRLAARLQRDFLPTSLPQVGPVRFSILFRPAGWVSGDIYDVTRLDEQHIGFYVADAVGHGMPAALLTMFIKQALPTKHIANRSYQIIEPSDAMAELNAAICGQNLSSCQFCSAVYGVIDCETLELSYARGGHPEPLVLRADGSTEELDAPGGLLGIFDEETYAPGRVKLGGGDRVVLYSDGAECVFRHRDSCGHDELIAEIIKARSLSPELMTLQLAGIIDDRSGGEPVEDDITVLVLDVAD